MANPAPTPDYTIADLEALFNISRQTVYRLIEAGSIYGYKVGAVTRISRESVDRFKVENPYTPASKSWSPKTGPKGGRPAGEYKSLA